MQHKSNEGIAVMRKEFKELTEEEMEIIVSAIAVAIIATAFFIAFSILFPDVNSTIRGILTSCVFVFYWLKARLFIKEIRANETTVSNGGIQ